jgi:uncharacterized protein involved in type VI secretion and phage assembly
MSGEFLKAQANSNDSGSGDEKSGLMAGKVIRNCDQARKGRVQVRLAARGGMEIWARVVLPDTGVYFIPQVDDEVVVAFHQGDGNEAFVMGRLWNDTKLPPRQGEKDPVTKRVILTPKELEISFDDTEESIVIKTKAGPHVTLKPESVEIGVDDKSSAVIKLDNKGNLNIEAKVGITLKAPTIELDATNLKLGSASSALIEIG